ncbi:MAG: integrase [Candidatus Aminicenantes bacterium]|nr:integrase [Candidatus Aminicenantes bacterium]
MDSMSKRYRQASRASKKRILDEVCAATGFHRKYAITRINLIETSRPSASAATRKRDRLYGREVLGVVQKVWEEAGYPWSVRLKAILLLWLPAIRKRYALTRAVEAQLLRISPRTIDRFLKDKKRKLRRRLYGRTRPGTLLRQQIPIKCEHWDVENAGHLELDTVSHCGGHGEGLFAYSFNLTDIGSTWVETRSVLGKGEVGIVKAFSEMSEVLPFKVLDIDSDNGGEFINHNLYGYCHDRDIGFTRGRPYKKDDNAHIEQKNWTHVRKLIGWDRYETPESVAALNDLYANELRLYMNLFQPSVKLIRTVRKGSHKVRRYDEPRTPLDRLAEMSGADRRKVEQLLHLRSRLDPFALSKIIRRKLERIWELRHTGKKTAKSKTVSDMEISQSLSRTLSTPHVVSSSL